jgi:hypothetical protein
VGLGLVTRVLPRRRLPERQLGDKRDVDQAEVVPLDQDDVPVGAVQIVADEVAQRADVLDLLEREHVGVHLENALGNPLRVLRVLALHELSPVGAVLAQRRSPLERIELLRLQLGHRLG